MMHFYNIYVGFAFFDHRRPLGKHTPDREKLLAISGNISMQKTCFVFNHTVYCIYFLLTFFVLTLILSLVLLVCALQQECEG